MRSRLLILTLLFCLNSFGQKLPITGLCFSDISAVVLKPNGVGGQMIPVSCLSEAFTYANPNYFDPYYAVVGSRCLSEFRNYGFTGTVPTIEFLETYNKSYTSISVTGNILSDGGLAVDQRGFCWNTTGNPRVTDNYILSGTGTGTFSDTITGLSEGGTYYISTYAHNSAGFSYDGNELVTLLSCTRPTGLTLRYLVNTVGGNDATSTEALACAGLFTIVDNSTAFTVRLAESSSMTVGTDVYDGYLQTNCNKTPDGYYILYSGAITKNDNIYYIRNGNILSISTCPQ